RPPVRLRLLPTTPPPPPSTLSPYTTLFRSAEPFPAQRGRRLRTLPRRPAHPPSHRDARPHEQPGQLRLLHPRHLVQRVELRGHVRRTFHAVLDAAHRVGRGQDEPELLEAVLPRRGDAREPRVASRLVRSVFPRPRND